MGDLAAEASIVSYHKWRIRVKREEVMESTDLITPDEFMGWVSRGGRLRPFRYYIQEIDIPADDPFFYMEVKGAISHASGSFIASRSFIVITNRLGDVIAYSKGFIEEGIMAVLELGI